MHARYTKALLSVAAVAAVAAPGVAIASQGSDDPPGHVRREDHRFDHNRRASGNTVRHDRRGSDDGVRHDRRGSDDGPNHH